METMQTEASRQLVLSYYDALASGNPADLEQILSDDVVWAPMVPSSDVRQR